RETDAICQVVRVFADPDVTHVDGDVSPERDIETGVTELILADLQTLEKALPRLAKETRFAKDPERARTAAAAEAAQRLLDSGTPLSSGAAAAGIDVRDLRELQLLTAKPFLYVFNMGVTELADEDLRKRLSALVAPAEVIFLDAKTEADLAELPEDEAAELLAEAGLGEPGLAHLNLETVRALLEHLDGIEATVSHWQEGAGPSKDEILKVRDEYLTWYASAQKLVPDEKLAKFRDAYEGGLVIKRIRDFLNS